MESTTASDFRTLRGLINIAHKNSNENSAGTLQTLGYALDFRDSQINFEVMKQNLTAENPVIGTAFYGLMLSNGWSVQEDRDKAEEQFRKAENSSSDSTNSTSPTESLGKTGDESKTVCRGDELFLERKYDSAREIYEKNLDDGQANYQLGIIYQQGLGVPVDLKKAQQYFRQAYYELKVEVALFGLAACQFEAKNYTLSYDNYKMAYSAQTTEQEFKGELESLQQMWLSFADQWDLSGAPDEKTMAQKIYQVLAKDYNVMALIKCHAKTEDVRGFSQEETRTHYSLLHTVNDLLEKENKTAYEKKQLVEGAYFLATFYKTSEWYMKAHEAGHKSAAQEIAKPYASASVPREHATELLSWFNRANTHDDVKAAEIFVELYSSDRLNEFWISDQFVRQMFEKAGQAFPKK